MSFLENEPPFYFCYISNLLLQFFDCHWNYKLLQPLQNLKLSASCVLCFLL